MSELPLSFPEKHDDQPRVFSCYIIDSAIPNGKLRITPNRQKLPDLKDYATSSPDTYQGLFLPDRSGTLAAGDPALEADVSINGYLVPATDFVTLETWEVLSEEEQKNCGEIGQFARLPRATFTMHLTKTRHNEHYIFNPNGTGLLVTDPVNIFQTLGAWHKKEKFEKLPVIFYE